ncbi:MAG TPA: LppX_LprAFG lipoprotein [Desulfobacteria bacterium]|nr:LppX_LprAFG lipoprotein [Desulfobacteria bacterium]
MLKFQERRLEPKWIGAVTGIVAILFLLGYFLFPGDPEIEPQTAISQGLKNTEQAKSYKYNIKMTTTIDGEQVVASNIKGDRERENRIHFSGKMFDSEVDFYLVDSTTFYKDQVTGEWTQISNGEVNQQDIFMQEINPLAGFRYREITNSKFAGNEKIDGNNYWVFTADVSIVNPYMEILWKDFKCRFWLTPRSLLIKKALITGVGKEKPQDKLDLMVEFSDFNKRIKVTPPK